MGVKSSVYVGVHLCDVWHACHLSFSSFSQPFGVSFSSYQPFYVPYNMLAFPLCVITCLLCLLCATLFGFLCFLASLNPLFIYSCMHLCVLVCVIKFSSYLMISCGFTHVFLHEVSNPFQELLLMSHVCHLYSNTMELWTPNPIPHLSFQDTLFCMITCLFAPLYAFFPCLPLYALPLFLCYHFACLLAQFSLLLQVPTWSEGATSKMQARRRKPKEGNVQQFRIFSLSCGYLFLSPSLFLQNLVSRLGFLFLYLAQAAFLGYDNV